MTMKHSELGFLLLLLVCITTTISRAHHVYDANWHQYKIDYSKSYASEGEEASRYAIWRQELTRINLHNQRYLGGSESFEQGINAFSDMSWDEIESIYLYNLNLEQEFGNASAFSSSCQRPIKGSGRQEIPTSIDWRYYGWVTSVLDQGRCRASWAFAAAGALEGQMMNSTGMVTLLSVQQLLDCDMISDGCRGGFPHMALRYTQANGIDSWSDYIYRERQLWCMDRFNTPVFYNYGGDLTQVYSGESVLEEWVATRGPVVIAIRAGHDLFRYRQGVYHFQDCSQIPVNHIALVIGYGVTSDTNERYWIVKNSWGGWWGEQGYIRMARDNDVCNLAVYMTVPIA